MIQSLRWISYEINCTLKNHDYPFDITTSDQFLKSRKAFDDACKELKKEGYGHIVHTDISPKGNKILFLNNIYHRSKYFTKTHPFVSIKKHQSNVTSKHLLIHTYLISKHELCKQTLKYCFLL